MALGMDKLRYFAQSGNFKTTGQFKVSISLILPGRETFKGGDTVCLDKQTMSCVPRVPDGSGRVEYIFYLKAGGAAVPAGLCFHACLLACSRLMLLVHCRAQQQQLSGAGSHTALCIHLPLRAVRSTDSLPCCLLITAHAQGERYCPMMLTHLDDASLHA
jgi:hypothetical protein